MTRIMHNLSMAVLLATAVIVFPQRAVLAQDASSQAPSKVRAADDFQPITDEEIQMLRKDIRSQRKQLIAVNMKLTDSEAEKFWPVYEQYVSELVSINGAKYVLVKEYVQSQGALTDPQAENAVKQWVGIDQSVAELRTKYIPIFRKILSPRKTALFYQLDRRVQLMIDLQLASSLPLVEP